MNRRISQQILKHGEIGTLIMLTCISTKIGVYGFLRFSIPLFPVAANGTMLILLVTVIGFVVLTIKKSETLRRDKNILSLEQNHINTDSS